MKMTTSSRLAALLEKKGITSYLDVIEHLPRKYDSFALSSRQELLHMSDKQRVVVYGSVVNSPQLLRFKGASQVRFYLDSETGLEFQLIAWNQPYLARQIVAGERYTIVASYDASRHCLTMISLRKGKVSPEETLLPVYTLPEGYPPASYRALVKKSLEKTKGTIRDIVPLYLREKYRLIPKEEAFAKCHFPMTLEDVHQGSRTLKYEEAFLFTLRNQALRKENASLTHSRERQFDHAALTRFVRSLPYSLTQSQNKACREIVTDMEKKELMNRLLQGDVGTGKTIVAAIALYVCHLRGQQGAIMAPTDALARQHYAFLKSFFANTSLRISLLVGSLKPQERKKICDGLAKGEIDIAVGTHALFSKDVIYADLGLVIIDEQHKFGVRARSALASKGNDADLLLMSATPIPRTLSMTLHGDLNVSTLEDYPCGKRNVRTVLLKEKSPKVDSLISSCLQQHRSIFVVAPQIEEGMKESASAKAVFDSISKRFPNETVLLHGKMNDEEKEAAMMAFLSKEKHILVATSVIEVGIDAKDAGLMIVYEAHQFSLSSLHQLRGRVGRDGKEATMVLLSDGEEEDKEKLQIILETDDGFAIAEADLRRRGPGTFAGTIQSGFPDFRYANVIDDIKVFQAARADATEALASNDPYILSLAASLLKESDALLDS